MILYISSSAALIYGIRTSKWEFTKRKHIISPICFSVLSCYTIHNKVHKGEMAQCLQKEQQSVSSVQVLWGKVWLPTCKRQDTISLFSREQKQKHKPYWIMVLYGRKRSKN